jgi:hypothetical protein
LPSDELYPWKIRSYGASKPQLYCALLVVLNFPLSSSLLKFPRGCTIKSRDTIGRLLFKLFHFKSCYTNPLLLLAGSYKHPCPHLLSWLRDMDPSCRLEELNVMALEREPCEGQIPILRSPYKPWYQLILPHTSTSCYQLCTLSKPNNLLNMMAFSTILPAFLLSTLLVSSQAYSGSLAAPRDFQKRATYNGGWPLGLSGPTCPAEAPVACQDPAKAINPTCCPTGQTCFGFSSPYCCPTGTFLAPFPNFSHRPETTPQREVSSQYKDRMLTRIC